MKTFLLSLLNKIQQALKSKTFWLVVVTFLVNGITPIRTLIDPKLLPYLDSVLAILTTLTHLFPSQNYSE